MKVLEPGSFEAFAFWGISFLNGDMEDMINNKTPSSRIRLGFGGHTQAS
jgi:hypothetical protein